ncbi:MAG: hypothetical protein JWP04_4010 [Belnapia sp.]|nr:hypothetical protein [Belnapia sp.]
MAHTGIWRMPPRGLDRSRAGPEHKSNIMPQPFAPPPATPHALDRPALLAALRARPATEGAKTSLPLCAPIDQTLPGGGLARAALHEVVAGDRTAAAGFCALVLARAAASGGRVLWIAADPMARPRGLGRFGLAPADLVLVWAPVAADALWAMEEALRCPGVAGALLELPEAAWDPTLGRRLRDAAGTGGAIGLLLRPDGPAAAAEVPETLTRWRVGGLGSSALSGQGGTPDLGDPCWQVELLRCHGTRPGSLPARWQVRWRPAAERLEPDIPDADLSEPSPSPIAPRRPRLPRRHYG